MLRLFDDNFPEVSDYGTPDWDGDGAEAISEATIKTARFIFELIPNNIRNPDIAPGADGTIAFQWNRRIRGKNEFFIIEIGPGERASARLVDEHGSNRFII